MSRGGRYDNYLSDTPMYTNPSHSPDTGHISGLIPIPDSDVYEPPELSSYECTPTSISSLDGGSIPISTFEPDCSRVRKGNSCHSNIGGSPSTLSDNNRLDLTERVTVGAIDGTYDAPNSNYPPAPMTLRQSIIAIAREQFGRIGSPALFTPYCGVNGSMDNPDPTTFNTSTVSLEEEPFLIGHKPRQVSSLVFNLLRNWGNPYYIGIAGVEIFDGKWHRIVPHIPTPDSPDAPFTVHSSFDDIIEKSDGAFSGADHLIGTLRNSYIANVKTVSNVDNIVSCGNLGCPNKRGVTDVNKMFQIPIINRFLEGGAKEDVDGTCSATAGNQSAFWINFKDPVDISLIRIFNYNAGRTQVSKGVRLMKIVTDSEQLLFRGEIREADGTSLSEPENILFANDEEMEALSAAVALDYKEKDYVCEASDPLCDETLKSNLNSSVEVPFSPGPSSFPETFGNMDNISLSTSNGTYKKSISFAPSIIPKDNARTIGDKMSDKITHSPPGSCPKDVTGLCIEIISTWGDAHFVGLSGIKFYTSKRDRIYGIHQLFLSRPDQEFDMYEAAEEAANYFREFDHEVSGLVDDDPNTAAVWRYQSGLQIRVLFDTPIADGIGFIDIANYGIEGSTHTGAKHINMYLSTNTNTVSSKSIIADSSFDRIYDTEKAELAQYGIHILTTDDPVLLRKSPNQLSILKFQSFDLSIDSLSMNSHGLQLPSVLSSSMNASVVIRNIVDMRRACIMLQAPPEPSALFHIPHVTLVKSCILPIGYVFKLDITLLVGVSCCGDSILDSDSADAVRGRLKGVLRSVINEGINNTDVNNRVRMYDYNGGLIDTELYHPGVSIALQEDSCISPYNYSDLVSSSNTDRNYPAVDSMTLNGPFLSNSYGRGGTKPSSGGSVRSASHVSRIRHHRATSWDPSLSQGKLDGDTRYSMSEVNDYVKAVISLIYVFDVPFALSAISYRFSELMRKPQQNNIIYTASTSVSVSVDDTVVYQSFEKDCGVSGNENGEITNQLLGEEVPRCVAFTYDIPFINKIAVECL